MIDRQAVEDLVRRNPCLFCQQHDTFKFEWVTDTRADWLTDERVTQFTAIVTCKACEARTVRLFD